MADRLLILGASARAAAASARRAGFEPFAIDLFADADTQRICDCLKCPPEDYPNGLFRLARQAPPMPWMYTGGLENYPELVGGLAAERELWGNGPEVLRRVRDPFTLSSVLETTGCHFPKVLSPMDPMPTTGRWLRKPARGSGGSGIRWAEPRDFERPASDARFILQEWIAGEPMSALFLSERLPAPLRPSWPRTILTAIFRQLIGTPWLHAPPFRYAGNLGPIDLAGNGWSGFAVRTQHMNDQTVHLSGIWGMDFVRAGDSIHILEVNPRYPASEELVGRSRGVLTLLTTGSCFSDPDALLKSKAWQEWPRKVGKAIYYAPHRLTFPASGPWDDSLVHAADVWRRPDYADIPHAGDVIERGHPILTILTGADTEADCLTRLQSRAADLDRLFGVCP